MRTLAYLLYHALSLYNRQPPERPHWRNEALAGDPEATTAMLSYGGLTANASRTERGNAVALYRSFNKRHEVWLRNLAGHDGLYASLCRARLWSWLADGIDTLQRLRRRNRHRSFFLFGHSTGALVVVILAWMAQSLRGIVLRQEQNVAGVILIAPAFYLKQRSAAVLLGLVLVIYYLCLPLAALLLLRQGLLEGAVSLAVLLLAWKLLQSLSIPSGETIRTEPEATVQRWLHLLLTQVIWIGLTPLILSLIAPPRSSTAMSAAYSFYGLSLAALYWLVPYGFAVLHKPPEDVDRRSSGFEWLPLMATAHLLPLQLLARISFLKLHAPVLVILCEQDETVNNERAEQLCCLRMERTKAEVEIVLLRDTPHSGFSDEQNAVYRSYLEAWLRKQMEASEDSKERINAE